MRILRSADLTEIRELRTRGEFFWLDLDNADEDTLAEVGHALDLHQLALEDTQEFDQRPKLDLYDNQLLLVYYGAGIDANFAPVPVEVHLHISDGYVFTAHRLPCEMFERTRDRVERQPPASEQILIYRVIDALTDSLLDVLERVAERVDDYGTAVFSRPRARDRDRMAMLRRSLQSFRRLIVIQRQVFDRMVERHQELPGLTDDLMTYYRDVGDHLWRAVDEIEAARESLQGMLETYTNEVQERLTIVATIFLPLTLVTGFFGMNFNWLISHIGATWTFWGLGVGGLLASTLAITLWLIRSGLYEGPGSG